MGRAARAGKERDARAARRFALHACACVRRTREGEAAARDSGETRGEGARRAAFGRRLGRGSGGGYCGTLYGPWRLTDISSSGVTVVSPGVAQVSYPHDMVLGPTHNF